MQLNHRQYERGWRQLDFCHMDGNGVALICVGSGLMMATMDDFYIMGIPMCCVVDAGRLEAAELIGLIDWACHTVGHELVAVNIWRSRGSLVDLVPQMQRLTDDEKCKIVFRLRGNGENQIDDIGVKNYREYNDYLNIIKSYFTSLPMNGNLARIAKMVSKFELPLGGNEV